MFLTMFLLHVFHQIIGFSTKLSYSKLEYFNLGDNNKKPATGLVTKHATEFLTDFFANTAQPTGFKLDRDVSAIIVA